MSSGFFIVWETKFTQGLNLSDLRRIVLRNYVHFKILSSYYALALIWTTQKDITNLLYLDVNLYFDEGDVKAVSPLWSVPKT